MLYRIAAVFLLSVMLYVPYAAAEGQSQDFQTWLNVLRREAVSKGISEKTVKLALHDGLKPLPRVLELDKKQPENTITFTQYKKNTVSQLRVQTGRLMMRRHASALAEASRHYDVPAAVIAALWGMETSYGNYTGGFNVVESLATLAYDGRRGAFFRGELMHALKILDEGHIAPKAMKGSWAGAMGQSQFMPSSFNRFAVDGNGDGRRDIWNTHQDVFASAANYLKQHGWRAGERWGRRVTLLPQFPDDRIGLDKEKTLAEWQALGVRREDGSDLPQVEGMKGSVIKLADKDVYLVYNNYKVIMLWNKSTYFATAVGLLSDKLSY
ncbi:MAG: lytic murein transglycosylase [Alphaproteobacteria bacterium]|nr:MAG: lytic murein transglycosylase [Alphaproteobacteria bacterium]